jgi:hypothetical protein
VRWALVSLSALSVLPPWGAAAAAQPEVERRHDSERRRVALASWSRSVGDKERFYTVAIDEYRRRLDGRVRYSTYFDVLTCHPSARPPRACTGAIDFDAKVVSFEMDPSMSAARAVLWLEGRRADVTWAGGLALIDEPGGVYGYHGADAERAWTQAGAWTNVYRDATARGEVFGRTFEEDELEYAYLTLSVEAGQYSCVAMWSCDDDHRQGISS